MKVTVDYDEAELAPVISEHLSSGTPVQETLKLAISLWNTCRKMTSDSKVIAAGSLKNGNMYDCVVLMKKESGESHGN